MIKYIIIVFLFTSGFFKYDSCAQTTNEIKMMRNIYPQKRKTKVKEKYQQARQNSNELQLVFSSLFLFYKDFISSQDSQKCSFHPSCSVYGLEAVKKYGPLKGMLAGFDRLTRCNMLDMEKYPLHPETNLLYDPIQ